MDLRSPKNGAYYRGYIGEPTTQAFTSFIRARLLISCELSLRAGSGDLVRTTGISKSIADKCRDGVNVLGRGVVV
jgi:hypothetical protein